MDGDGGGHEGVAADDADGVADAVFDVVKAGKPVVEVDAGVAQGVDAVGGNAVFGGFFEEAVGTHAAHAAVVVGDDHDFADTQFENGYQQAAHDRPPGMVDEGAGVFDEFGVAVFQAEGAGQEFGQAGVHAGEDGQAAFGVFVAEKLGVFAGFDEVAVEVEDVVEGVAHGGFLGCGGGGFQTASAGRVAV